MTFTLWINDLGDFTNGQHLWKRHMIKLVFDSIKSLTHKQLRRVSNVSFGNY